jgi:hypothetical protein
MKKLLLGILYSSLLLIPTGCFSQSQSLEKSRLVKSETNLVVTERLSHLLSVKDRDNFIKFFSPSGLQIYRGFSSGNLGGRGAPLFETLQAEDIKQDLTVDIRDQTSLDFPWLFPGLIAQKGIGLPVYRMGNDVIDLQNPAKTLSHFQKVLTGKLEMVEGFPLLLTSADGRDQVLVEAQIIEGEMVGGFAFFHIWDGKPMLSAIWDIR